jgi:3-phenylpropionate/trans-cinnamate dioxygenase ferredoxin subunit
LILLATENTNAEFFLIILPVVFSDSVATYITMGEKKYTWYKIANHLHELEFAANNIAVAEANGKKLCIGKHNDMPFSFAYKCPHAGGILADGYIDALGNVVCPLHRYKYNMQNGRNVSGEGYYLKHWPVELREDGVYVGMEESSGLFGFFR